MTLLDDLYLAPGDYVRLKHDFEDLAWRDFLLGTRGSIGRAVSFDEYLAYQAQVRSTYNPLTYETTRKSAEDAWQRCRKSMEGCAAYPIRFVRVQPLDEEVARHNRYSSYPHEGGIEAISAYALEKLNRLGAAAFFILDRVEFAEAQPSFPVAAGHNILRVEVTVAGDDGQALGFSGLARVWLTYVPRGEVETSARIIQPLDVAGPEPATTDEGKGPFWTAFQVSEGDGMLWLHVEVPGLGLGEVSIKRLRLRPHDRVRQTNMIEVPMRVGNILSVEAYYAFWNRAYPRFTLSSAYQSQIQRAVEQGMFYPVQFDDGEFALLPVEVLELAN
jgi:hypothetical protein